MPFNTDHLDRCVRTLGSSLDLYRQAQPGSIDQEVFRNAIIKGYELTQETGFKLLKRALQDFGHGRSKRDATPVKEILRQLIGHRCCAGRKAEPKGGGPSTS